MKGFNITEFLSHDQFLDNMVVYVSKAVHKRQCSHQLSTLMLETR